MKFKEVLTEVKNETKKNKLSLVAAGMAFYSLLGLIPALAATVSIYALISDPVEIQQQLDQLSGVIPEEVKGIFGSQLSRLASGSSGALSLGVVLSILFSLWSGARGSKALMEGVNIAYNQTERRSFVRKNLVGLSITFLGIIALILATGLVAAIPVVIGTFGLGGGSVDWVTLARWPLLAALAILGVGFIYRYAPCRQEGKTSWISWGAVVATGLWMLGSVLFSVYVSRFGNYNETYGSLGAVAVLMLWLFLTSFSVLLGAEVNAVIEGMQKEKTL